MTERRRLPLWVRILLAPFAIFFMMLVISLAIMTIGLGVPEGLGDFAIDLYDAVFYPPASA